MRRHFDNTLARLELGKGDRVLELGSGLGRFTGLLAERGFQVTALELSEQLACALAKRFESRPQIDVINDSALQLGDRFDQPFDAVLGFFFLHHIVDFERLFSQVAQVLKPGASLCFCEPNAFNPLYYLQVAMTPGLSFSGEPSLTSMRPSVVEPLMRKVGLSSISSKTYGLLPPFVANRKLGEKVERFLEQLPPFSSVHAYRLFSATSAGHGTD